MSKFQIQIQYNGRNPQSKGGISHIFHDTNEDAIEALYEAWASWMSREFFFKEQGEVLDEEEGITFDGESGWYDCNGNLAFETEDYPDSAAWWVAKQITWYTYDNWKMLIVEVEEDEDED